MGLILGRCRHLHRHPSGSNNQSPKIEIDYLWLNSILYLYCSVEGLDSQLNPAIPILDADLSNGRAEANPNPFASNLLQDPAIVESTPDLLTNPFIQPTDQTLTLGVNSTVNNK